MFAKAQDLHVLDRYGKFCIIVQRRKNSYTFLAFQYIGCLIWILLVVYHNPYLIRSYNPLQTLNNRVCFIAQFPLITFIKALEKWHPDTYFGGVSFLS